MADDSSMDRTRLFIPQLAGLYQLLSPFGYAFMRFATGAILLPHGIEKLLNFDVARSAAGIERRGLPFALLLAYLVVFTESFGALFLALGLFTRVMAMMVAIEMIVIVFFWQWNNGYIWTNKGYEFALLWFLLCIGIFFRGGGRYSLDRLIGKEF